MKESNRRLGEKYRQSDTVKQTEMNLEAVKNDREAAKNDRKSLREREIERESQFEA